MNQTWDAGLYDERHAFVWRYGSALLDLLAPRPGERILDLGCGTGHLTARIAERGAEVVGLDHSAEMLETARAAHPGITFFQGDARDFAVGNSFDAVFSNAVLHWIREPNRVVRCVRDALKPGGRFVAEFGGRGNVRAVMAAVRTAARSLGVPLEEPLWYNPGIAEYAALLEQEGLEVRFAELFDRPTALEGESGLRDWVTMFARGVVDAAGPRREAFLDEVEAAGRAHLREAEGWTADYRRLRIVAVREG